MCVGTQGAVAGGMVWGEWGGVEEWGLCACARGWAGGERGQGEGSGKHCKACEPVLVGGELSVSGHSYSLRGVFG